MTTKITLPITIELDDSIYGKRDPSTPESWTANPWVWVVSFERVEVPRG